MFHNSRATNIYVFFKYSFKYRSRCFKADLSQASDTSSLKRINSTIDQFFFFFKNFLILRIYPKNFDPWCLFDKTNNNSNRSTTNSLKRNGDIQFQEMWRFIGNGYSKMQIENYGNRWTFTRDWTSTTIIG